MAGACRWRDKDAWNRSGARGQSRRGGYTLLARLGVRTGGERVGGLGTAGARRQRGQGVQGGAAGRADGPSRDAVCARAGLMERIFCRVMVFRGGDGLNSTGRR